MRGAENYTGTAEIAEHDAQNSFLSVFHAADYLSTARAAASREKSKSRTTQTRKANLQEGKMITGYEVCKDPAEGELQKNGHTARDVHEERRFREDSPETSTSETSCKSARM